MRVAKALRNRISLLRAENAVEVSGALRADSSRRKHSRLKSKWQSAKPAWQELLLDRRQLRRRSLTGWEQLNGAGSEVSFWWCRRRSEAGS